MKIKQETKENYKLQNINIFAAIVFTDKDAFLSPIFEPKEDNHFFKALNAITDESILVYSVKLESGQYEFPTPRKGFFSFLVPVWKEPKKNSTFLKEFGLENSQELPLILFWCFDEKGKIRQRQFSLSKEYNNENEAYLDLKKYFEEVSSTINYVNAEHRLTTNVFRNVDDTLDTLKMKNNFVDLFKKLKTIYKVIKFFKD